MPCTWLDDSRLWLITDKAVCEPKTVSQVVGDVIYSGIDVVVIRDKTTVSQDERTKSAVAIAMVCKTAGIPFVVAHDLELATKLEASAIHLGKTDLPVQQVRKSVGANIAIGYSCHSISEANEVIHQGVDYVFLGPIFPSPEKLKYGDPIGIEVIPAALALPSTVIFIGGMDEMTIQLAVGQGAKRVAAIRAFQAGLNAATRVKSIARQFRLWDSQP